MPGGGKETLMLSPPRHALLLLVRLDLNEEKLDVLYDQSCSISYFLLVFSLNYPTSNFKSD